MNKEDNPFFTFAEKIKGNNEQNLYYIGTVISKTPLIIDIGQLQLEREDILINEQLKKNYKTKIKITKKDDESSDSNIPEGEIENIEDVFNINDKVVLISNDNQIFILVCIVS